MLKILNRNAFLHIGFTVLIIGILITLSTEYAHHERAIYSWDLGLYHDMTTLMTGMMRDLVGRPENVPDFVFTIIGSTGLDYNYYHTLLPGIALLLFGNTRSTYIAAIMAIYTLAYVLAIGVLAKQLIAPHSKWVFWSATFIALVLPGTWIPGLRGYPDVGAAACITLAIAIFLRDPKLKHRWQLFMIGFLLGVTPVFRRHFVYDVVILLPIAAATVLLRYRRDPDEQRPVFQAVARIGLVVFAMLLSLALFGFPFVIKTLSTNYGSLYAGYERPSGQVLAFLLNYNGWVICLLAIFGVAWGHQALRWLRWQTVFVIVFYGLLFLTWVLFVKELGYQYTAHFTTFVVIGLTSLLWTLGIKLRPAVRYIGIAALAVFLFANLVIALVPTGIFLASNSQSPDLQPEIDKWFSMQNPPLRDPDYDEIFRMVDYLQQITQPSDEVFVAASSYALNQSTFIHASRMMAMEGKLPTDQIDLKPRLNILASPDVDSRDFYPLPTLLRARYVVIASPVQYHLIPDMQRVVATTAAIFENHHPFANDFERLPRQFHLSDGALISIYKRIRPTSLTASWQTILEMQQVIPKRPGSQTAWMALLDGGVQISDYGAATNVAFDLHPDVPMSFLYLDSLPAAITITASVQLVNCTHPVLQLIMTNDDLQHPLGSITIPTGQPSFELKLASPNAHHLLLMAADQLSGVTVDEVCHVAIQNLVVRS